MVRLGGAASPTYISVFRGLKAHFLRHGIELDWVLYSDYDALVEAFIRREIDLAWNAPLAYVKIRRRLRDPCHVVAMREMKFTLSLACASVGHREREVARILRHVADRVEQGEFRVPT